MSECICLAAPVVANCSLLYDWGKIQVEMFPNMDERWGNALSPTNTFAGYEYDNIVYRELRKK